MPKSRIEKRRPTRIDEFLGQLTEEGKDAFYDFVSVERTLSDIQRWWSERGFSIALSTVDTWRRRHYQAGRRAKEIAQLVKEVRGVNAFNLLEYAAAESLFCVKAIRDKIDETEGYSQVLNMSMLKAIRELRTSAESLNNAKIRSDRTQDILSGAYEICRKALTASKDHPNERWIEEVLSGELRAIEEELIREQVGDANG